MTTTEPEYARRINRSPLAYVRHTGPYFGDERLFQRLFGELYRWAGPRDLVVRGVTEEIIIYHDEPETVAREKLCASCCIPVPADTETAGQVGLMTLAAGRYAQARFRLDATQFGAAWNWVFGEWLPQSGYQPDDRLCYERYQHHEPTEELDGTTGRAFVVDICVPVKPLPRCRVVVSNARCASPLAACARSGSMTLF